MVECWLPYGKGEVHVSVPLRNLLGTVEPDAGQPVLNPRETILNSIRDPVVSGKLSDIVKPGAKVSVAIDGSMTSKLAASALSCVVETLLQNGASKENISIIVGNGLRGRGDTERTKDLQASEGLRSIRLVEHSRGAENITDIGTTSRGTKVEISSPFVEADVRIVAGEVLVDHFTGLRGAQNTIVPAISGRATIEHNRSLSFKGDEAPGVILENQIYADGMEAAKMAEVDLAVNLVTNGRGELVAAFSGGPEESWGEALKALGESYKVKAEANADVIVVSAGGSRFDYDLYSSVWALNSVAKIAKKGATIILLAECPEGLGADGLSTLSQVETLSELRRRYMLGAKAVYLIKSVLRRNEVVLVSALPGYLAEPLGFSVERTGNEALRNVFGRRRGKQTLVVTHGCSTVPYVS